MRIIHVSPQKSHPGFSGIISEQALVHEIIFLLLNPCDNQEYDESCRSNENGILYIQLNVQNNYDFTSDLNLELAFSKILKEFEPDIVHIHLFSNINALSILESCSGFNTKKAITLHTHSLVCLSGACYNNGTTCPMISMKDCSCENCESSSKRNNLSLLNYNQLRKERLNTIVALTDIIICCSHWQKDTIQQLIGKKEKLEVIYHAVEFPQKYKTIKNITKISIESVGLNWNDFVTIMIQNGWASKINPTTILLDKYAHKHKDKIQNILGKDFEKFLSIVKQPVEIVRNNNLTICFGYLGTLWELKGLNVLIDAIKHMNKQNFEIIMGIFSETESSQTDSDIEHLKKSIPQAKIIQNLQRDDFHEKLFGQIDYLIIPSVWEETGPMTLFESFYFKTPVIISSRPSMVEKTKKGINSLVFNNSHDLAKIMDNIIETRDSLGEKTRENYPVKSYKEYAEILDSLYSKTPKSNNGNTFTLNIGSICNSNCVYCVRGKNSAINNVDFNVIKEMLEKYSGKFEFLKITGGEPTLRKDLMSILETAKQLGYKKIFLETNGRKFAHAKLAKKIASYGPRITLHLESYKPDIHDIVNQSKGSFFEAVSGIRNLLKFNGDVDLKIMIGKYNYRDILKISKFATKLGVQHMQFIFIDPGGFAEQNFVKIIPKYSEVQPYLEEALTWLMEETAVCILLENFPLCCINPKFHAFEMQRNKEQKTTNLSYAPIVNQEKMYEPTLERLKRKGKASSCSSCKYNNMCEGVYKKYTETYGWHDFSPITQK